MSAAIVSALHLLALVLGLSSVYFRGRALRGRLDSDGFKRLFVADSVWGIAAGLWLVTGLLRVFGGLEKGTAFYFASTLFWIKMALFALILILEIWPMTTFIRWRIALRRGAAPDTAAARGLYRVNHVEMAVVVLMVFVAAFMARGFGVK